MIYKGKEKENHRGSHVRYYHCGRWHEGTLLEPVNYQIVVTKENPPAVLSCTASSLAFDSDLDKAVRNVSNRAYTQKDLDILSEHLPTPLVPEVETVEITEANDITQEEADGILESLKEKYLKQ